MPKVDWGKVGRFIGKHRGEPLVIIEEDAQNPGEYLIIRGAKNFSDEITYFDPPISTSQLNENSSGPVVEILRASYKWMNYSKHIPEQVPYFWVE